MPITMPEVTLALAAALAVLNVWLSIRVGAVRRSEKVSVGDGGNERVVRRMRAHANFAENAWVVLALVLAVELALGANLWLWLAAAMFVVARVLHGIGMDGWVAGRSAGTGLTLLLQLLLAGWAVALLVTTPRPGQATTITLPSRG